MENENQSINTFISKERTKVIKIVIIVFLFSLPLIYLFYNTRGLSESAVPQNATSVQTSVNDIPILEKAVAENPTFDNLINLSLAYINNKMPGRSIDHLQKAISLNPNSAIAYNNLGVAYIQLQQYQNGMDACTKALQIDPSFQLAKNNLNWGIDEKNKVLAAIKVQEQIPQEKRNLAFYSDYGLNYFKIGDYSKSIEIWNKIFEIDKKNADALNSIGTAFMMKQQIDDAIVLFKKAIVFEPDNQIAKNNLAWALSEKEKRN